MTKLTGYHGTKREFADEIQAKKLFELSRDEEDWLGLGVYFFEDDPRQAYYFCVKARKVAVPAVLRSLIETDRLLDLTLTEHRELFQDFAKRMKNGYKKRNDGRPRKIIDAVVLNAMYKLNPYDVVRADYVIPGGSVVDRTLLVPIHRQICVRNRDCIKTIEEVPENEYKAV